MPLLHNADLYTHFLSRTPELCNYELNYLQELGILSAQILIMKMHNWGVHILLDLYEHHIDRNITDHVQAEYINNLEIDDCTWEQFFQILIYIDLA